MDGPGGVGEDVAELFQGKSCLSICWWQNRLALGFVEGSSEILGCSDDSVVGCGCGHLECVWKPVDGVDNLCSVGGRGPDGKATIVVQAGSDVVTADGMNRKGFTSICRFVGEDLYAGWCKWRFVVIEISVDLGIRGELWVDAGGTEKIEGNDSLWKKFVPEVQWEVRMCGAEV